MRRREKDRKKAKDRMREKRIEMYRDRYTERAASLRKAHGEDRLRK